MHFWITELNFGHPFYGVIPGDDGIVVTLPVLKLTMLTVGVHAAMGIMPRVIVINPLLDFFLVYQADVSIFYTSNLY